MGGKSRKLPKKLNLHNGNQVKREISANEVMRLTKGELTVTVGLGLVLLLGLAAIKIREKSQLPPVRYAWQTGDARYALDHAPSEVLIVPTATEPGNSSFCVGGDQEIGRNYSVQEMLEEIWGFASYRTIIDTRLPGGNYDFLSNLRRTRTRPCRTEFQHKFGVQVNQQQREREVLQLKVKNTSAADLRASAEELQSSDEKAGSDGYQFTAAGWKFCNLASRTEGWLHAPVTDYTGLAGKHDINLNWKPRFWGATKLSSRKRSWIHLDWSWFRPRRRSRCWWWKRRNRAGWCHLSLSADMGMVNVCDG